MVIFLCWLSVLCEGNASNSDIMFRKSQFHFFMVFGTNPISLIDLILYCDLAIGSSLECWEMI